MADPGGEFAAVRHELRYSKLVRIGFIFFGDLQQITGGNVYDKFLVDHLAANGHEVDLFAVPEQSYAHHLTHNTSSDLSRALDGRSYDLLLQDELAHPSLFRLNRDLKRSLGAPIVSVVHHLRSSEDWPAREKRLYRRVEERYLETIDGFVFNSETTRESVEAILQKIAWSIVATPGGDRLPALLTRSQIEERAREPGERKLLFVGNLIERKGLHVLLDALAELKDEAFRLDIVGRDDLDPDYAREMQAKCAQLGLTSKVQFSGALDGEALAERYRRSHALVVPSLYEGFGIVFLEAMGFGLPVIAGGGGASDEIVRHETTGLLVQPHDIFGLAIQLRRLIEDQQLLARLSTAALETFATHPTWQQSMTAIESFLIEVASKKT